MNPADILGAAAVGDPAVARSLAPACRAQAFGAEAFGPAAIAELFGRRPAPLSPTPDVLEGPRTLALFDADPDGGEQAWFADLHDGLITRLWRLGAGERDRSAEPALAFANDPFLTQSRDAVAVRAEDHPDLDRSALGALAQAGADAAQGPDADRPAAQGRAFVLRALSQGDRCAALLMVAGLEGGPRLAAVRLRVAGGRLVHARAVWDAERPALRRPPL